MDNIRAHDMALFNTFSQCLKAADTPECYAAFEKATGKNASDDMRAWIDFAAGRDPQLLVVWNQIKTADPQAFMKRG